MRQPPIILPPASPGRLHVTGINGDTNGGATG